MSEAEYDYTAGESVPVEEIDAKSFVIAGTGETNLDAEKIESDNSFADMEPGDYLLKVAGFGTIKKVLKTAYLNGHPDNYEAYQIEVRFVDANDPRGRIRNYFLLPPATARELVLYNTGTNAGGKAAGFMAQIFTHFIERLLPGKAYVTGPNGAKVLTPFAQSIGNWEGKMIWAQVEAGKAQKNADGSEKLNPATQEPFPVRTQIKLYSFKPYVEGGPSPFPAKKGTAPQSKPAPKGMTEPALAGAGSSNGFASAGLDDI